MSKHLLQILILAAGSDGEIQKEELAIIHKYKEHYPSLKSLSPIEYDTQIAGVFNKIKAGMSPEYLIDDIGKNIDDSEKATAYALAYEICASNFTIVPPENDLLDLIKQKWKINNEDHNAILRSINIRYKIT
jgi:hypothetical protein